MKKSILVVLMLALVVASQVTAYACGADGEHDKAKTEATKA